MQSLELPHFYDPVLGQLLCGSQRQCWVWPLLASTYRQQRQILAVDVFRFFYAPRLRSETWGTPNSKIQ
jgi:hypothetical protein